MMMLRVGAQNSTACDFCQNITSDKTGGIAPKNAHRRNDRRKTKIIRGVFFKTVNHLVEREISPAPNHTKKRMKSITTLIKAGALLAVIAGFGLATALASDACNSCCKTSCSSCAKCADGKCSTCCK
jgi:hypothetical protein